MTRKFVTRLSETHPCDLDVRRRVILRTKVVFHSHNARHPEIESHDIIMPGLRESGRMDNIYFQCPVVSYRIVSHPIPPPSTLIIYRTFEGGHLPRHGRQWSNITPPPPTPDSHCVRPGKINQAPPFSNIKVGLCALKYCLCALLDTEPPGPGLPTIYYPAITATSLLNNNVESWPCHGG
jgi:hypothetical protein